MFPPTSIPNYIFHESEKLDSNLLLYPQPDCFMGRVLGAYPGPQVLKGTICHEMKRSTLIPLSERS